MRKKNIKPILGKIELFFANNNNKTKMSEEKKQSIKMG